MINFAKVVVGAIPVVTTLASILLKESEERRDIISVKEKAPPMQVSPPIQQKQIQPLVPQDINLTVNVNIKLPDFDSKTGDFLTRGMRYYP